MCMACRIDGWSSRSDSYGVSRVGRPNSSRNVTDTEPSKSWPARNPSGITVYGSGVVLRNGSLVPVTWPMASRSCSAVSRLGRRCEKLKTSDRLEASVRHESW